MPLPQVFQSQSAALANYDAVDILEGTGIETMYGCVTAISGSTSYNLIKNIVWSALSGSTPAANSETIYNFDTPALNIPRIVKGTGYISFCLQNGAGSDGYYYKVQLNKYDGTTTTALSSEYTTAKIVHDTESKTYLISLPVTTPVQIKAGEKIRLTIKAECDAGVVNPKIFHNPKDQTFTGAEFTKLEVGIPFQVDL